MSSMQAAWCTNAGGHGDPATKDMGCGGHLLLLSCKPSVLHSSTLWLGMPVGRAIWPAGHETVAAAAITPSRGSWTRKVWCSDQ
jgi:hypothetical protein